MALDKHQRRFRLTVTEIDVGILPSNRRKGTEGDLVQVEFAGKLLPSTKKRIHQALAKGNWDITERHLA